MGDRRNCAGFLGSNSRKSPSTPLAPSPHALGLEEPEEELLEPRQTVDLCGADPGRSGVLCSGFRQPPGPWLGRDQKSNTQFTLTRPPFPAGTAHRPTQVGARLAVPPGPDRAGRGRALRGLGRSLRPQGPYVGGMVSADTLHTPPQSGWQGAEAGGRRAVGKGAVQEHRAHHGIQSHRRE